MNVEPLRDVVFAEVRRALVVLGGAVVLVLLIACANVAGLLLARGRVHARQTAVRAALGASGGRLARQFLAENLLLALLGAAGGIGLAYVVLGTLTRLIPPDVPRATTLDLDIRALTLAAALSVVLGVLFALVPLVHARRTPAHVIRSLDRLHAVDPGFRAEGVLERVGTLPGVTAASIAEAHPSSVNRCASVPRIARSWV